MTKKIERVEVKELHIAKATALFEEMLRLRIQQKGSGAFVSLHELRGALDEEFEELKEALHLKDRTKIKWELLDQMIPAFWGLVSMEAGAF